MADWKAQRSYNYNQSNHAYTYSLVYQAGTEQGHGNVSPWDETGLVDLSNYPSGVNQAYYTPVATQRSPEEQSPPHSPEPQAYSGHGHYQGIGLAFLADSQANLLQTGQPPENESRRAGSDSASDSEPHTSPDSWSSVSSGELPQADPATWSHKDETSSRSPDANEDTVKEDPQTFCIVGSESTTNTSTSLNAPLIDSKNQSITKGKGRAAFSESQMKALVQRFNMQRYLTPAEMKHLAELTGLTYKQVKTWFQNRRMKLRRHQKDNSWASERYSINKDNPSYGAVFPNFSSHIQPYQGETRPPLNKHYNYHIMEAAFKKTVSPNMAFYLTTMGSAAGSAGYPSWSSSSTQTGVQGRPQAPSWPVPSEVSRYDYNPNAYNPQSLGVGHGAGFSKEGEQLNNKTSHNTVIVQNPNH